MRIVDAQTARALDADAIEGRGLPGMVLMERAALGAADAIRARWPGARTALALVGGGNNGGDGSAVARLLTCAGWDVTIILCAAPDRMTPDGRAQLDIARRFGVAIVDADDALVEDLLRTHELWIDALTGIGATPPLRGRAADLVHLAGRVRDARGAGRPRVVAIDVPSGTCASTGRIDPAALAADLTVTFGATRWAHWLSPAAAHCGEIALVDIGLAPDAVARAPGATVVDRTFVSARVAPMASDTHKGRQGRVAIVAGSDDMPGAAVLAARAALASGAGLVTVASTEPVRAAVIGHAPEAMTRPHDRLPDAADAWLIGPGLGTDTRARARLEAALDARGDAPAILDADALNLLAGAPRSFVAPTVLSPHPAELGRLLDVSTAEVVGDLPGAAREAAARYGAVVVAKTAGALIVGEGPDVFVRPGSPGMATAGSGDVLAGIITGLAARMSAGDAARAGAWLHAQAGRRAAHASSPEAVVASAIVDHLGAAFAALHRG